MQPGLKVRGREYLRIIYGPDYTDSLDLLRDRAPGQEAVASPCASTVSGWRRSPASSTGEPLWRVHQAVFAVLALESEPVDPRL